MRSVSLSEICLISAAGDETLSAVAFTSSNDLSSDNSSWLSTLVHEAWHIVQQISGNQNLNAGSPNVDIQAS